MLQFKENARNYTPTRAHTVDIEYTHPKWKLYTFIMGFTMHAKETLVPPNVEIKMQSFVGMLNFIKWGVSL